MDENRFTGWIPWSRRSSAEGLQYPGVYAVAYADRDIGGEPFSWRKEIIYIGMTNGASGLRGRLRKFDHTISGGRGHGGADRVRFKYQEYDKLEPKLYVAVALFKCSVTSEEPGDLRIMGEVAKFEYSCFAHFAEAFGQLPEFNRKKDSPKHSKTLGNRPAYGR